ncbi:hypothetical protein [Salinimicrobium soli]
MVSIKLDYRFLENYDHLFTVGNKKPSPIAQAFTSLMTLTGISRLFEKEDVYELVKRAHLLFPEQDMITDFFENDVLLYFSVNQKIHQLDAGNLKEFIGFEIADVNENHVSFERWATNIPNYKTHAALISSYGEILNLDTSRSNVSGNLDNLEIDFGNRPDDVPFTHEDVTKAEHFASAVIKSIPAAAYDRLKAQFPNKFRELEMRKAPFDEPVFDFGSFPVEKQKELWQHFFPQMENFDDAPTREYYERLIHLAWLWSNGFVIDEDINWVHIDFRIKSLDPEDLEVEDDSNDLLNIKMLHNLDEIFPLLHDPEIAKLAERPWENLNIYS